MQWNYGLQGKIRLIAENVKWIAAGSLAEDPPNWGWSILISGLTSRVKVEETDHLGSGDESCHQQVVSIPADVEFDLTNAPGHLIRRAQQVHTSAWTEVVGEELTSSQFAVLNVLYDKPDIDQTTLSQLASLDTSTCQDIVARLKQKGLVERVRDIGDGRRWRLRLSENGRHTRATVIPKVIEVGEILFGSMSLADRADFARLLCDVTRRSDNGR